MTLTLFDRVILKLKYHHMLDHLSDSIYLKLMYYVNFHRHLNLKNPRSFNEKLQWLKLYDRKPEYSVMVDKYEAKQYVAERIGQEHIIPTLGVWNRFDEIDFDSLPDQFVLKCTHDSGGLVICRDKTKLDKEAARVKIERSMRTNYYYNGREWPYKDVKPRIIAEKYMVDKENEELLDYKFFCFNGQAKCFKVDFDRFVEHHANYYDVENNLLRLGEIICPPEYARQIKFPQTLPEMKKLAELLSAKIPFLRADFYDVDGKVYFGELTFFPAAGFGRFIEEEWDYKLGEWLKLPDFIGEGYILIDDSIVIYYCEKEKQIKPVGLTDYKFYCFGGKPKYLYISEGLEDHLTASISFLNLDWSFAPFGRSDYKPFKTLPEKPSLYDEMITLAKKLSAGNRFLRVDLYQINNEIYFSELTFTPCAGFMPFSPPEWDEKLGELIDLSNDE